jgi:hypothetical protein
MAAQEKDVAIHVDKSISTPVAVSKQLLPFLIGGGSGIVSTTMYAIKQSTLKLIQRERTNINRFTSLQPIVRSDPVLGPRVVLRADGISSVLTQCTGHNQSAITTPW